MPKKEFNSDKPMKLRRRLSFAETLRCMAPADMVTHAHMPTATTSSRKRLISQATSWLNYVYNSTSKVRVLTARDANTSTQSTISKLNSHMFKHWKRELDLPNWETSRSVDRASALTASGPTSRPRMDAVLQRSQDLQCLKKSTTRKTTTLNSTMRTSWRGRILPAQWVTTLNKAWKTSPTNSLNPWTITITTIIWTTTWDSRLTICRTTLSIKTIKEIKCTTTIIINSKTSIKIIRTILTADSRPIHHQPTTSQTRTSNRFGLELGMAIHI